jgi:GTP-binding protein
LKISDVSFLKSASKLSETPQDNLLEIAFMGRSNVGKSSLINSIVNRTHLAKSSNRPGKTQLINFFNISLKSDNLNIFNFRIVDLPGIGYAKVSKEQKKEWDKRLNEYISLRENIAIFVYLIDSRHLNLQIDNGVLEFLNSNLKPHQSILKVFTKIDKLKKSQLHSLKAKNKNEIFISNLKKSGISELRNKLFEEIKNY